MQRRRRIKSHLSTLISSISLPAERADNVKKCCRTQSFCENIPGSSESKTGWREMKGGGGWGDYNRKEEKHSSIDYRRQTCVLLPANGSIDLNIHAHGRGQCTDTVLEADLAHWLPSPPPPPPPPLPSPVCFYSTQ